MERYRLIDQLDHAELDGYPGPGYNTLLLRLILGYLYSLSACPHRQFHTLPGL